MSSYVGVGVAAVCLWLGWQVTREVLIRQAPAEAAVKIAPGSALALTRAAETERLAGRPDNAAWLAQRALSIAPFNTAALRILGLARSEAGDREAADDLITLAGNWSLRDDPAHGWLVEQRLRQGDYGSAFAHAETLLRRRNDLRPATFNLFSEAAKASDAARGALVAMLAAQPAWRASYMRSLVTDDSSLGLALSLAQGLAQTKSPLTRTEAAPIAERLWITRRYDGLRLLRAALKIDTLLENGDFEVALSTDPFGWTVSRRPGVSAEVEPQVEGANALNLTHDSFSSGALISQRLVLLPGSYVFSGRHQARQGGSELWSWQLLCASGQRLNLTPTNDAVITSDGRFGLTFTVPSDNECQGQTVSLMPHLADRRSASGARISALSISREG